MSCVVVFVGIPRDPDSLDFQISRSLQLAIIINILHDIWEGRSEEVSMEEPDLRFFY